MKVAVVSGKGGTGKSTVTASFIALADKKGYDVTAIDCDTDASNLFLVYNPKIDFEKHFLTGVHAVIDQDKCSRCGICYNNCAFDAISRTDDGFYIDPVSCDGCKLCARLCPNGAISLIKSDSSMIYGGKFQHGYMLYGRMSPGEENSGKMVSAIREISREKIYDTNSDSSAKATENKDSIEILDGPPGIGCPVISTLTGIDKIVVVTEPTLSGLSDMKRVIELANAFSCEIFVIINKYDLNTKVADNIELWCKTKGIPVITKIPFDRQMINAIINNQCINDYDPKSICSIKLSEAFDKII